MDYILNKVNYQTLIMMLSDAPRYVSHRKRAGDDPGQTAEDEAGKVAQFFRSNLKQ